MTALPHIVYAFTLGLIAVLNPCGFPLLPAYLAVFARDDSDRHLLGRVSRALVAGGCVTTGFVLVFAVGGFAVSEGLRGAEAALPYLMVIVGIGLAVLGVVYAVGGHVRVPLPAVKTSGGRRALSMVWFGVAYALGSISCSLPVFLAAVGASFTQTGMVGVALSFVAYALGMGVFVCGASVVTALAGTALLRRVGPASRLVPRLAGGLLVVVGAYLSYYWISVLVEPTITPALVAVVDGIQQAVAGWLGANWRAVTVVMGGLVVAALIVLASRRKETSV